MMRGVFKLLVWLCVIALIWAGSFAWFVRTVTLYPDQISDKAQGIIVLTGGGGRVEYGLELLAKKQGDALFISGVNKKVPLGDVISQAPESARALLNVFSGGKITLGREATNTIGNAEESAVWVEERGYKTILLVTADYHMPRSLLEFETRLPGVQFIPAAVKTANYADISWVNQPEKRNLLLSEFHKRIAAQLRHWFFLKGVNA